MFVRSPPGRLLVLVIEVLAALAPRDVGAQSMRFADRDDRDEAEITTHEISGGYFNLAGVQLESEPTHFESVEESSVTFWLSEPKNWASRFGCRRRTTG